MGACTPFNQHRLTLCRPYFLTRDKNAKLIKESRDGDRVRACENAGKYWSAALSGRCRRGATSCASSPSAGANPAKSLISFMPTGEQETMVCGAVGPLPARRYILCLEPPAPIPAKSLISFMPTGEQETNSSLVARGAPRPRGQGGRGEWHMETGWCGGPSATNFLLKYSGRMALAYSVVSCPGCCSTSAAYRLQGLPWPPGIVGPAVLPVLRELLGQDEGRR